MSWVVLTMALVGGLACPLHMFWRHRRGRAAPCGPRGRAPHEDLEGLRRRHQEVSARIAELETDPPRASSKPVS